MAMPPPQPGQVINGFRFTGGNPADRASWAKADDMVGADSRARMMMGLSGAVQAHRRMSEMEKSENPLQRDWGATIASGIPMVGDTIAKGIGGQDYQDYATAMKTYEAAILPILSGANVTPSEAPRQQGALGPQLGDSVQSLHDKGRTRAMQLNGAARGMGLPPPFPEVETFGVTQPQQGAQPQGQGRMQQPSPQQQGGIPVYDLSGRQIR